MQILLISGFLGAGKTTFIKELIRRTDKRPVILENEYGANNLDSLDIQKAAGDAGKKEELKVLEFMEGCVCCTMKDSFVNSVLAIYASLNPEYLIIEPTGVGRLSSIIENLKPILGRVNFLLEPVVVVSPANFRSNMKEWPELYTDQIAAAGKVVFSKCEHLDAKELKAATDQIININPRAKITDRHYTQMEDAWWDEILGPEKSEDEVNITVAGKADKSPNEGAEAFSQVSITTGGLHNPGELIQLLEDCLHGEFGLVSRAKGTIWVGSEVLRFDLADKLYVVGASPDDNCQCVFIGKGLNEKKLRDRLTGEGRRMLRR